MLSLNVFHLFLFLKFRIILELFLIIFYYNLFNYFFLFIVAFGMCSERRYWESCETISSRSWAVLRWISGHPTSATVEVLVSSQSICGEEIRWSRVCRCGVRFAVFGGASPCVGDGRLCCANEGWPSGADSGLALIELQEVELSISS